MPSEVRSIDGSDLKRWGVLVGTGAAVGALSVVAGQVIPEISEMGGSVNAMIVLSLTFAVDFARRFLTDTRVIEKVEVEKMVVLDKNPATLKNEKISVIGWARGMFK